MDHMLEVRLGEGFGDMEVRRREHCAWPVFFSKFIYAAKGPFQIIDSPHPFNVQPTIEKLANVHFSGEAVGSSFNSVSSRLFEIANSQTEVCANSFVWPSALWLDNDTSRIGEAPQSEP